MSISLFNEEVVRQLKRMSPWVTTTSMITILITMLYAAFTVVSVMSGASLISGLDKITGKSLTDSLLLQESITLVLTTLFFVIISLKLYRFSSAIKLALREHSIEAFESFLRTQADIWKLIGFLSIGALVLMLVSVLALIYILSLAS